MNVVATIRPAVIKLCSCLHQQILNDISHHLEFISLVEEEVGASVHTVRPIFRRTGIRHDDDDRLEDFALASSNT
jgi:hypothetical protein